MTPVNSNGGSVILISDWLNSNIELEIGVNVINRDVFLLGISGDLWNPNWDWCFAVRKIRKILTKSGKLACMHISVHLYHKSS